MALPQVRTPELDGALGITPPTSGLPMAVVGQCVSGPFNTPALFARAKDIQANFTGGRAAEAACYAVERFRKPVIVVRAETSEAHAYGTLDDSLFAGTSTVTIDSTNPPNDDYEVAFRFPTGGTVGVSGITLQWSLSRGREWSPVTALGTANTFTVPGAGGVKINFGVGTVTANDYLEFTASAKSPNESEIDAALLSLRQTALLWEFAQLCGAITASKADVMSAWLTSMHNAGKHKFGFGSFRIPNPGESEASYLSAFATAFGAFGDTSMLIGAGACKVQSSIARRRYRRPVAHPVAALLSSVSEEEDIAQILIGRLPGVEIRDANGNLEAGYHDENENPGLDDARALTLRTWEGETGVYVNNPRLISPVGSDFDFSQKRRVMNLARAYVEFFFRRVTSRKFRINKKTGFLRESELLGLESSVNQGLENLLLAAPKASSVRVVLSRTDAVTKPPYPLTGQLRMIPLAYPKDISIESGWALTEEFQITGVAAA